MCVSAAGRVTEIDRDRSEALVDVGDRRQLVSLALLTLDGVEVREGDWLVVSLGLALERVTEPEARRYGPWMDDRRSSIPEGGVP